jgi:hypothetical protein
MVKSRELKVRKVVNPVGNTPPIVNVISDSLASGGDTKQARQSYQTRRKFLSIMNVEKKRSRSEETISLSKKDRGDVEGSMMMSLSFP